MNAVRGDAGGLAGWRPIKTAPRDGTRILGYAVSDANDVQPQIITWDVDEQTGWLISWDNTPWDKKGWEPFTHWQPLPDPPTTPARPGEE